MPAVSIPHGDDGAAQVFSATRQRRRDNGTLRVDGLSAQLEACFAIQRLPRMGKKPLKSTYSCRFCNTFSKTLQGTQRVLEHAMGCDIHGHPVKGCPVKGSEAAGTRGIPIAARDDLRKTYDLPGWSSSDATSKRTRRAAPAETSEARWHSMV